MMRPLEEVQAQVIGAMGRLDAETVRFTDAVGRILAEPLVAPHDVPHFANSAMDGFAVRSEDVSESGSELRVLEDVPAGRVADTSVGPGQAIRIMTGAPIPQGSDAVVKVEDTSAEGDTVTIQAKAGAGLNVRPAGGDVEAGCTIFEAGVRMSPMHVGVLATLGITEAVVSKRPRVAVMSTGDELQPADTPDLAPGMIRDSNRPMMMALLDEVGAEILDLGRIPDDADALRAAIGRAVAEADAIVTSGGVSMGDYDVTKIVLRDEVGIDFMQVAMKPGKPLGFGRIGGVPFFGLPGNPVSVMISFENFARPALLAMQGATALFRPRVGGVAGETLTTDPAKTVFLRVLVEERDGVWWATRTGGQDSNVLSGAALAGALAVVPRGVDVIEEGEPVTLELLRSQETREQIHAG
jgi:molybdopterin molybdotransferase